MPLTILKIAFRCLLLFSVMELAGCTQDTEDQDFYYRGWTRPKMTRDDRDYFYRDKTQRSGPPEEPRMPTGELQ